MQYSTIFLNDTVYNINIQLVLAKFQNKLKTISVSAVQQRYYFPCDLCMLPLDPLLDFPGMLGFELLVPLFEMGLPLLPNTAGFFGTDPGFGAELKDEPLACE